MKFFKKKQADEISVYVGLLMLAIIIFMADIIKLILSINLFFVAIEIFIVYTVVRGIIQVENTEVKKKILKYSGIVIVAMGVFVVMVHFLGAIRLITVPIGCLLAASDK